MRGSVGVYYKDKLIYEETNLLVNGAGSLLADIMTVSPSLSGVPDHATSSILDSSNYTIQAISFGTAQSAYAENAHIYTESKAYLLSSVFGGTSSVIDVIRHREPLTADWKTVSSYSPTSLLPHYSDPSLPTLEVSSDVSAVVSGIALSSIVPGNGQNLNLIPSAYHHAVFLNTALSSLSAVGGAILGCWPEGSGGSTEAGSVGGTDFSAFSGTSLSAPEDVAYSGTYNGMFNAASSMDTSGFVNMIMSASPNDADAYLMSSTTSGLCVSGGTDTGNSGTVEYSLTLGKGDLGGANLYGGIYNMGLWTIDIDKSLLAGNTPPYSFDTLNNPRKYRLFAVKSFSRNIARITDAAGPAAGCINYGDCLIKWRIHFL